MFYLILILTLIFVIVYLWNLSGSNRTILVGTTARILGTGAVATARFTAESVVMVSRSARLASMATEDAGQDTINTYHTVGLHIKEEGGSIAYGNRLGANGADFVGIINGNASLLDSIEDRKNARRERRSSSSTSETSSES